MISAGRLLLVDDEETFLRSTAALLRREGYECVCASDAATAAKLLREDGYDVLITDIKMPGNIDLELVRELPHIATGVPVILVTGYPSLQTATAAVQLSVVAYLVKPFDFSELLANVRSALAREQAAVEQRRLFREAEEAEARFRILFESAPDAIVLADSDGCLRLVNRQTEALFGYHREELLGQPVEFLLPERFQQAHALHRARYFFSPRTRPMGTGLEIYGRRKDGSEFPVDVTQPRDPGGDGNGHRHHP
jgi:PAS domain S-box-containing protein